VVIVDGSSVVDDGKVIDYYETDAETVDLVDLEFELVEVYNSLFLELESCFGGGRSIV